MQSPDWGVHHKRIQPYDSTVSALQEYGYAVCNPYVAMSESGRQYRCTISECGCGNCNCQDDFMEK